LKQKPFLFFLLFIIYLFSCKPCPQEKQIPPVIIITDTIKIDKIVSEQLKNYLEDVDTAETIVLLNDSLFATRFIIKLYAQNNYTGVWFKKGKRIPQNDSLYKIIENADEYGLISNDYHVEKIDSLLQLINGKKINTGAITQAELLLTDAFFTLCIHVNKGRLNPDSLTREWKGEQADTNLVDILNCALERNTVRAAIDSLEPKNREYTALKQALKDLKDRFKCYSWDSIFYESVDSIPFEERLKNRLIASNHYFNEYVGSPKIKLEKAIKEFQCQHCLKEDGKIGKLTYMALQKSSEDYIHQIEMNMERWRYYKKPADEAYTWVNIPSYKLRVIEKDSVVLQSRIIVGKPDNPTPILHSTIRYFLIYPYWNVPYKIATKELLPILQKNPDYLNCNNFEVLDGSNQVVSCPVNWEKYREDYFPWRLRQRIGDDNSLGILKFYFNNEYGVYIHDTNNKNLFYLEDRAMSHGCVRLEKFVDFALYLIHKDSLRYPSDSLRCDLIEEQQKYVYLRHPFPIYINYFTVEVNKQNELIYLMDVYKRDEKMLRSLDNKTVQ
jgi:L,D-transpeptidase YcbB